MPVVLFLECCCSFSKLNIDPQFQAQTFDNTYPKTNCCDDVEGRDVNLS
jgi:hypothetical protein